VNKNPTDTTVCRYLFTAKLLYMFRVSQHPSWGVLKTVPAASGTGHTTCTATPLQRGLIGTARRLRVQFLILLMMGAVTPETCRVVLQWINICILLYLLDFYSHWIKMHGTMSLIFFFSKSKRSTEHGGCIWGRWHGNVPDRSISCVRIYFKGDGPFFLFHLYSELG